MGLVTSEKMTSTMHTAHMQCAPSPLRPMRKGTKSCQECRRRKIKCDYPSPSDSIADPRSTTSNASDSGDTTAVPAMAESAATNTKCVECLKHNRVCEIQGYVDSTASPSDSNRVSRPKRPIYKRRREVADGADSAGLHHDDRGRRHLEIRVDRMPSIVERIARGRQLHSDRVTNDAYPPPKREETPAFGNLQSFPSRDQPHTSHTSGSMRSQDRLHMNPVLELQEPPRPSGNGSVVEKIEVLEEKDMCPLLSQLFNNEVFTQTPYPLSKLTYKLQALSFSNRDSTTDMDKLRATISSEPYLLKVLDISVYWWVAWRDQAFALHKAFFQPAISKPSSTPGRSGSSESDPGTSPRLAPPISLQDFVRTKLAQESVVHFATGLLCIAMSLQQLRPGVDDLDLHLTTSPAELAERIILAIDAILLSPASNPTYKRDPGILLLLMMRGKMYAETHQLRKSWLMIRTAVETARDTGFTDIQYPDGGASHLPNPSEEEINLFHRQRFVGSILEVDRLLSLVLGLPYAEDERFSDRLALAVLRGQVSASSQNPEAPAPLDIKMRALRRVVAVAAGRINDSNARSESIEAKLPTIMSIQSTLDEAAAAMPPGWWDVDSHLYHPDPFVAYEHLHTQMWFWQVQSFLHMPIMLMPAPDAMLGMTGDSDQVAPSLDPYEQNRYLCLQGSRGMLRAFSLLRLEPSMAVFICPCEDFQGVFGACILMVGLLLRRNHWPHPSLPWTTSEAGLEDDLALLKDIEDVFSYRAQQQGGGISKAGVQVLEALGSFLDENSGVTASRTRTVILPYFGAIHLHMKPSQQSYQTTDSSDNLEPGLTGSLTSLPRSTEESVDGATSTSQRSISQASAPEADVFDDAILPFSTDDTSLDWDHFLFGDELDQSWNLHLPDVPLEGSWWQ